jgi:serine/threonine protein kinase
MLSETRTGRWLLAPDDESSSRGACYHYVHGEFSSGDVLARFEALRPQLQALAHPGVVRTHEAGFDEAGRLYFLMGPVTGVPIDTFCSTQRIDLLGRVELVEQACAVLQYAHDRGIAHHAIEPGNFLVNEGGEGRRVEVAGFGAAASIFGPGGSLRLDEMAPPGPGLEYLAPEQTGHAPATEASRTDVRALGVVLYQLLVGEVPHDAATIRSSLAMGMLDWMYRDDPPMASVRLELQGPTSEATAAARGTTTRQLRAALRAGLDGILARALAPDPEDRFESPAVFARVLRSYREKQPPEPFWAKPVRFWRSLRGWRGGFASGERDRVEWDAWSGGNVPGEPR